MSAAEIEREVRASWRSFYSLNAIIKRTRAGPLRKLSPVGKFVYAVTCLVFYTLYPDGIAADNARKTRLTLLGKLRVRILIYVTRQTSDWFGIRSGKPARKHKQEMFASDSRGPTLGAELN
jgi:hypothetical protein